MQALSVVQSLVESLMCSIIIYWVWDIEYQAGIAVGCNRPELLQLLTLRP